MGPYCRYCDMRCSVLRTVRDGRTLLLATCSTGRVHDLGKLGEDHSTAVNPIKDPAGAQAILRDKQPLRPEEFCGFCAHHWRAHDYSGSGEQVPCLACPDIVCPRAEAEDTCVCRGPETPHMPGLRGCSSGPADLPVTAG